MQCPSPIDAENRRMIQLPKSHALFTFRWDMGVVQVIYLLLSGRGPQFKLLLLCS
jgi:hypothetical protein